jgi:reverse gyrase
MQVKDKGLFFLCSYCRTELNEDQIFDFRGTVGCENCLRDYYRSSTAEEVESQLRARRRKAATWLNRNRRSLERHARKAAPSTKAGFRPVA